MHMPSPMALLVIAIVVLVLFGRGKVSSLMGEFGKGITAFKKGMDDGRREIEDVTVTRDGIPPAGAHTTTTTTTSADGTVTTITPDRDRV